MDNQRWNILLDQIDQQFGTISRNKKPIYRENRFGEKEKFGHLETVIFNSASGKMKMERTTRPKIIDKKELYTKGKGNSTTEYTYSENEKSHDLKGYLWKEQSQSWQEINLSTTFSI